MITTVRSKMKYEATTTETGKMGVSKIGLKPVMRDDFEYEVLTALHFDEDHKVTVVKDNTQVFDSGVYMTADYGKELFSFLTEGIDINSKREERRLKVIKSIEDFMSRGDKQVEVIMKTVSQQATNKYGLADWRDLPLASLNNVRNRLNEEVGNG